MSMMRYRFRRCSVKVVFMFWGLILCLLCPFSIWTNLMIILSRHMNERVDHLESEMHLVQQLFPSTDKTIKPCTCTAGAGNFTSEHVPSSGNFTAIGHPENDTTIIAPLKVKSQVVAHMEPLCRTLPAGVDYCEIEGDIRIEANTSTIFVVTPDEQIIPNSTTSWTTKPYVRWYIKDVKLWTVKIVRYSETKDNIKLKCTHDNYHSSPAILFSIGGQIGNYFHSFSDLLFPLYATSVGFQRDVHFLASDYQGWWLMKFHEILNLLTNHPIVDIDSETGQVHCYHKMVVGLKFHNDLIVDERSAAEYAAGVSMQNFRQLLRDAYSLERKTAIDLRQLNLSSPRLMILSRKKSRIILNEDVICEAAKQLGFEVVLADGSNMDVFRFAELVNSCDVLMGIHGSGLTNMVFLPDNAVLIQVLPFGELDVIANIDYRDPTTGMNIQYLEYKISANESTLSQDYPIDHPVLADPGSIHDQGWLVMSSVYLNNQNFTIDVGKLNNTLVQAMKLLHRIH